MECIVLDGWNNGHILKKVVYIFYDVIKDVNIVHRGVR